MLTSTWPRPSVIDDDRALETDIMRFMAILGFCLMAVFALIQSIPVSQQTGGVGLQTQPMLEQQLTQLHEQVRGLLTQVVGLQSEVEALEEANNQQKAQNQVLVEQLARSEAQLLEQLVAAQELVSSVESEQQTLASLQSQVLRLQRQAYREQLRLESTQRALEQLQKTITPQSVPVEASKASVPEPVVTEVPKPQPRVPQPVAAPIKSQPPSLTMRFASTAAIERLIAGQRTVLYGISGQRAWRSTAQGEFVATAKPSRPYELTESPGQRLMQRFRIGSGLLSATNVQWWVSLDDGIVRQIAAHLDVHRNGQLVIQADGRVLHEPAAVAALTE